MCRKAREREKEKGESVREGQKNYGDIGTLKKYQENWKC